MAAGVKPVPYTMCACLDCLLELLLWRRCKYLFNLID